LGARYDAKVTSTHIATTEPPTSGTELAHGTEPHGDHAEGPGPINPMAWAAGIAGILLGLVVALCLAFATGYIS
jgi:hypothetical protein